MGASITYYYNIVEPGTFMYHCHVEATEHMQMGMLGNLYVHPQQDGASYPCGANTLRASPTTTAMALPATMSNTPFNWVPSIRISTTPATACNRCPSPT